MPETGKPTLIERFKADTNLYDLLPKYGYKKVSSDEYVSPNSQSGYKVKLTDDKSSIMSLSGSDEGIGKESKNGAWLANSFDLFLHYECGGDLKDAIGKLKDHYSKQEIPEAIKQPALPTKLFVRVSEIDLTPPSPIIDTILFEQTYAAITGGSYTGKTFFALDMFLAVAAGIEFHGRTTKKGKVLYVLGEGKTGIMQRIDTWCAVNGVNYKELDFYLSTMPINLRDDQLINRVKKEITAINEVSVVVIDTLNRNFGGGNENSPGDMGEFIDGCSSIIHECGCSVVVLHHVGKDQSAGARGHSSFYAALDTEIWTAKHRQHDIKVTCGKQKDAPEFTPMQFMKVSTRNSVVLEETDLEQRPAEAKLGKNDRIALEAFEEALEAKQATSEGKSECCLHLDEWRPVFNRRHTGDNKKSKNTAFTRARSDLVSKGILQVEDDYYSFGDKATFGDKR